MVRGEPSGIEIVASTAESSSEPLPAAEEPEAEADGPAMAETEGAKDADSDAEADEVSSDNSEVTAEDGARADAPSPPPQAVGASRAPTAKADREKMRDM